MSEIELVFRRAERQCSGSLFSMLLCTKLYLMQIFNQYLSIKRMIHVQMYVCMDTNIAAWIKLSFTSSNNKFLHYNVRNLIGFLTSWVYFRCSYLKKLYLMQIFSQYIYIKRMIHVHFWIRIYLLELNNLLEGVKDVMNTR